MSELFDDVFTETDAEKLLKHGNGSTAARSLIEAEKHPVCSVSDFIMLTDGFFLCDGDTFAAYREMLYISNNTHLRYKQLIIPKRNGGERRLSVPFGELAIYQRIIKDDILPLYPVDPHATAYIKHKSIKDNATIHAGHEVTVKIDLKDFFDSIKFPTVYNALSQNRDFDRRTVVMLAKLCCVDGHLPQGACTSPALSNICFRRCDEVISDYCDNRGIFYSRYSDDLTFSGSFNPYKLINHIYKLLRAYGYTPNESKTSIRHKGQRMTVTGLLIGTAPRTTKEYRKAIRRDMYYIGKYGVRSHLIKIQNPDYIVNGKYQIKKYLYSLYGRIGFALYIDPTDAELQKYRQTVMDMLKK